MNQPNHWGPKLSNLCAAYLAMGFMSKGPLTAGESVAAGGEVSALSHVVEYADDLCRVLDVADLFDYDSPGVFAYEVTEPLGSWLRDNPDSTRQEFLDQMMIVIRDYFGHDCMEVLWITQTSYSPETARARSITLPQRASTHQVTALFCDAGALSERIQTRHAPTVQLICSADGHATRRFVRLPASTVARISGTVQFDVVDGISLTKDGAGQLATWAQQLLASSKG